MTIQEIDKKVMKRYRVTKLELRCINERTKRIELRKLYKQRLINEYGINDIKKVAVD